MKALEEDLRIGDFYGYTSLLVYTVCCADACKYRFQNTPSYNVILFDLTHLHFYNLSPYDLEYLTFRNLRAQSYINTQFSKITLRYAIASATGIRTLALVDNLPLPQIWFSR
jgi:hypothetical protein